jgi:hypothetical protein
MRVRAFEVRRWHVALAILAAVILLSPFGIVLPSAFHKNGSGQCDAGSSDAGTSGRSGSRSTTTHTVLEPSAQSKMLNWSFDGNRSPTYWDVVLTATPALPTADPGQIDITPSRVVRTDNHEAFKKGLTFSRPTIKAGGKKILFRVCADPEGIQAGTYNGVIDVDAAGDVTGTSLLVSVTARSQFWFGVGLWVVFGVILAGLTLKSIADYQRALRGTDDKKFVWWRAVTYVWRGEDLRILSTLIGIVTALISYSILYNGDHTWGTDAWKSLLAAAQGAFAAIGAQGVLDGFRGGAQQQAPESHATSSAQVKSDP